MTNSTTTTTNTTTTTTTMTGGGVYNAYEYPPHHRAEMSFYAPTNNIVINSVYKSIVSLLEKSKLFFFFTGIVLGALFVYMAMLVQDDEYTTAMHINPLPVSGSGSGNTNYYINLMKARRGWMDKDYEAADGGRSSETQHEPTTKKQDDEKRELKAYGSGAALFVQYGAYRGASNSFAVVGLASKPLYVFGEPRFECYWEPIYTLGSNNRSSSSAPRDVSKQHGKRGIKGIAKAMLPDVGYGRVYTTVVVNCTFNDTVGSSSSSSSSSSSPSPSLVLGGQLVLYASAGLSNDPLIRNATIRKRSKKERIVALRESGRFNESRFDGPPYPYDILYCGSPIFGHVNEARIRDWMAYHVRLFGARSHFVFHDAGGMHPRVRAVLEPWRRKGHVTIQDVRAEAEFDSHYHNQFLLLNDCLHRTRFLANWTFFFDVDEFIYVAPELSIHKILSWHANDTLLRFQQLRMSNSVCIPHPPANPRAACNSTRVGAHKDANNPTIMSDTPMERLAYGEPFMDTKYAVQARHVYATGVHSSQVELGHMEGNNAWAWWPQMRFYHYHDTISKHGSLCTHTSTNSTFTLNGHTYTLDTSMVPLASLTKCFEQQQELHEITPH